MKKTNGKLKICLDLIDLNMYIKREYFLIPTVDKTRAKLVNKNILTAMNFRNGFYHIPLSKEFYSCG